MRIGLLTDLHYCSRKVMLGRRYPQLALARAQQAMRDFARAGVELVVCLGDLIDAEETPGQNEQNLRAAAAVLQSAGVPCACVMGNHDCAAFAPEDFSRLSGLQIAPCTFLQGDVALHFLNANFDWQGNPYRPGAVDWTQARLPEEALARVRAAMADTAHRHFFFLHQCLDPGVEQRHILQNAAEIRALLKTGRTAAVFQGHYHPGFRSVRGGIPYITLAALCEGAESSALLIDTDDFPA